MQINMQMYIDAVTVVYHCGSNHATFFHLGFLYVLFMVLLNQSNFV
jgi:hypothetical protein